MSKPQIPLGGQPQDFVVIVHLVAVELYDQVAILIYNVEHVEPGTLQTQPRQAAYAILTAPPGSIGLVLELGVIHVLRVLIRPLTTHSARVTFVV